MDRSAFRTLRLCVVLLTACAFSVFADKPDLVTTAVRRVIEPGQ